MCGARFRPCSPLSVDDPLNRHHEEGAAAVAISRTGRGSGGGAALPSSGRPHGHCHRSHDTCFPGGFRERGQRTRPECSGEPGAVVTQPRAPASRTPRAGSGAGHAPPPRAHRPCSRERRLAGGQGHVLLTRPHTRTAPRRPNATSEPDGTSTRPSHAVLRCVCGIIASSGTEPVSHTFVERLPCARPRGARGGERPAGPAVGWEGQGASPPVFQQLDRSPQVVRLLRGGCLAEAAGGGSRGRWTGGGRQSCGWRPLQHPAPAAWACVFAACAHAAAQRFGRSWSVTGGERPRSSTLVLLQVPGMTCHSMDCCVGCVPRRPRRRCDSESRHRASPACAGFAMSGKRLVSWAQRPHLKAGLDNNPSFWAYGEGRKSKSVSTT